MRLTILTGILGIMSLVVVAGCEKSTGSGCKNVSVDSEKAIMEAFITASGINATRHNTGMYYQIMNAGSNTRPGQLNRVFVKYKGTFFDGKVFDSQTNPGVTGFQLSTLIEGWKIGIPLIGKGGSIKLVIPSAMAYGCKGSGSGATAIPSNTPLYFEIELVDFL
ncbi:MAG: FKBP-type peptidyl-prolyl cis-trans isomerase [Chitinophagaceae bacterium]|jgi:FKBP-type peptidyl-prolyl cis-trans isomerase|nr:FKBP-type peptidyl-prolyl cis-trans isomerase [Chitinophagaceae bacterium]